MGLGKILRNSQNIRAYYMINHLIICIYLLTSEGRTRGWSGASFILCFHPECTDELLRPVTERSLDFKKVGFVTAYAFTACKRRICLQVNENKDKWFTPSYLLVNRLALLEIETKQSNTACSYPSCADDRKFSYFRKRWTKLRPDCESSDYHFKRKAFSKTSVYI